LLKTGFLLPNWAAAVVITNKEGVKGSAEMTTDDNLTDGSKEVSSTDLHSSTYNLFILVLTIFSLLIMVLLLPMLSPPTQRTLQFIDTLISQQPFVTRACWLCAQMRAFSLPTPPVYARQLEGRWSMLAHPYARPSLMWK